MRFHNKKLNQNRMIIFRKKCQNLSATPRIILLVIFLFLLYFLSSTYYSHLPKNDAAGITFPTLFSTINTGNNLPTTTDACMVSYGRYNGHRYQSPTQTLYEKKCLVESKWMRVVQHVVKLDAHAKDIIDDWLFIDYHDRINVLVQDPKSTNDDPYFLVFEQTKYSLEGRSSLAVVGGIIEPHESPLSAAKREVYEEMNGLVCQTFVNLGRYRTDVNRGIGWVNGFLARDCSLKGQGDMSDHADMVGDGAEADVAEEVGEPDAERQDLLSISLQVLKERAKRGEFLEVQWSNTVALALLHIS